MSEQDSTPATSRPGSPVAPLPDFSSSKPYRFTWDASTRRPGPASVSGTSEGRGDYISYKPQLGQLNVSSSSLALGAIPPDWSSSRLGFNAISNVVNNPHKRSAPPKAYAAVPPVLTTVLPRVRRKDFEPYLKAVAPEWEQFERNLQQAREGNAASVDSVASRFLQAAQDTPATPISPRFSMGSAIPSLESIPSVFFDPNFDLADPKTFARVTEQREGEEDALDPAALAHSLPLLEKLSHYADTIELHLIREISLRSTSFFAALTNLHDLQMESSQCLERIRKLRGMLKDVDRQCARKGLEVFQQEHKLQNLEEVQQGTKVIQNVGQLFGVARGLANAGEWGEALGVVDRIRELWEPSPTEQSQPLAKAKGKSRPVSSYGGSSGLTAVPESPSENFSERTPPPLPLKSLVAFASLPEHLRALTLDIATSLTTELVTTLKTDLLVRLDNASQSSAPGSTWTDGADLEAHSLFRDRLRPVIHGLKRTNGMKEAVERWREVALAEVRASVKRLLPSSDELDEDDASSYGRSGVERADALRSHLRTMSHVEFMSLSRRMYASLHAAIQGLQEQNAMLVDALNDLGSQDSSGNAQSTAENLADILPSATELAHVRASKVLSIRSEQHAALDLSSFLEVFSESWDFIIRTETICRKMFVGLRGVVVSQAKLFLQTTHQTRISQSAKVVEEEQWAAAEVPASSQSVTNIIIDSAVRDPPELVLNTAKQNGSTDGSPQHTQVNGSPPTASTGASSSNPERAASAKQLSIEGSKYFAVSATLQMLELLVDYLRLIINLPLLTTDAVGRVIEFLKAFNSRTCQVVLGAGAMRSAGLKNITAKHLALASQSLSIVVALIPYVRECFRRHLNPKQAVMLVEFDKLKRDYQEHQQEIHLKLVAIMGDRLTAHCKTLQAVDWNTPRDGVNDYMQVLVKETVTLHKVLSRYLPEGILEYIMSQVFASMNHRLSEEYGKIALPNQAAKDQLLRDVRHLMHNLSALKNVNVPFSMLETVVQEKPLPKPAPPTPMPTPTRTISVTESANDRIRSIFKRHSTVDSSDAKHAAPVPTSPALVPPEKDTPNTGANERTSPPPPPTPEKPTTCIVRSPPPLSPGEVANTRFGQSQSPVKALPESPDQVSIDGASQSSETLVSPPEQESVDPEEADGLPSTAPVTVADGGTGEKPSPAATDAVQVNGTAAHEP